MIEHREDFEPFVEDDVPFQTHVRQLSQPGTYGGHDALVAFARMFKVNIVIHQLNSPLWQIEGGPNGCSQLHLSYHNGEHYSSVRLVGDTSETSANVRIAINASGGPEMSSNNNVNKKNRERRFTCTQEEATGECAYNDDDNIVQKIANRTGCKDLALVHEALADHDGDEQGAMDYVLSLMMATDSAEGINLMAGPDPPGGVDSAIGSGEEIDETASASATGSASGKAENSSSGGRAKTKPPAKKLTNKQRKEQNRREKAVRAQKAASDSKTAGGNENGHADDAIVVEAAFGCLRI